MEWTRREVAAVIASGLLAGCSGVSVPSVPSMPSVPNPLGGGGTATPADGAAGDGASTSGSGATATEAPASTATPTPEDPAAPTRRVFAEVEWFGTRYGPETERFRSLATRTSDLADSLSRRSSVGADTVAALDSLTGRVETSAYDRLGPHFDTTPSVRSFNSEHVARVETLRAREDWDGVASVLAEMADRYATYASAAYVERTFPRDPVGGPLADRATAPGRDDDVVLMCYHVDSGETVRVQRAPSTYRGTPAGGASDLDRLRRLFGPLAAGDGGEAGLYVTATSLVSGAASPVSIRRYPSADAASTAVERTVANRVTEDGTGRLGAHEWRRVFYRPGTDVVYANLTRLGRFVVAAAPSERPWDARPNGWREPLELIWLER